MKKILASVLTVAMITIGISSTSVFAAKDTSGHWANGYISNAQAEGWLDVKNDGAFYPNENATRQEVVYMVYSSQLNRNTVLDTTASAELNEFSDQDKIDEKYLTAFKNLRANGLINGYNDGTIKPTGDITRAEVSTIISQLIGDAPLTAEFYGFADTLPSWASINIERCARAGIVSGYQDHTFKANNNVTRAEIVVMLKKLNDFNEKIKTERTTITTTQAKPIEVSTEVTTEQSTEVTSEDITETTTIAVDTAKAEELLQEINNKRSEENINTLSLNDEMNKIAMRKAVEMYQDKIDDPNATSLGSIDKMLSDANIKYTGSLEMICKGVSRGVDVVANWDNNSDLHDQYMTANYDQCGIGYYEGQWVVIYIRN